MRIAAVNWQIEPCGSVIEFFAHVERLLNQCEGADLVVFPELPCLELLAGAPGLEPTDVPRYLAKELQPTLSRFSKYVREREFTLVAGSYFAQTSAGCVNTSVVATSIEEPCVTSDVPKVVLTQYELHEWNIRPGVGLRRLSDRRIGVTVCYDCEFPESGRVLAESGVLIQCVPAFTETGHGFHRVRSSCRARAIENQTLVVHASLVGSLGREPVPSTFGSSAILGPCTPPFPEDGILGETAFGVEGVVVVDVDLDALLAARQSGDVRNWEDRAKGDWSLTEPTYLE